VHFDARSARLLPVLGSEQQRNELSLQPFLARNHGNPFGHLLGRRSECGPFQITIFAEELDLLLAQAVLLPISGAVDVRKKRSDRLMVS